MKKIKHNGRFYEIDMDCVFEKTRKDTSNGYGDWDRVGDLCSYYKTFGRGCCEHAHFTRLKHTWRPIRCTSKTRKKKLVNAFLLTAAIEKL